MNNGVSKYINMKLNENDKITLTIGQLKRLLKESHRINEWYDSPSPPDPDPLYEYLNLQDETDIFNYSMDKFGIYDYYNQRLNHSEDKERYDRLKTIFMDIVKTGKTWEALDKIYDSSDLDDMDEVGTYELAHLIHKVGLDKAIEKIYDEEIKARNEI